jgi:hypothetical protein
MSGLRIFSVDLIVEFGKITIFSYALFYLYRGKLYLKGLVKDLILDNVTKDYPFYDDK